MVENTVTDTDGFTKCPCGRKVVDPRYLPAHRAMSWHHKQWLRSIDPDEMPIRTYADADRYMEVLATQSEEAPYTFKDHLRVFNPEEYKRRFG